MLLHICLLVYHFVFNTSKLYHRLCRHCSALSETQMDSVQMFFLTFHLMWIITIQFNFLSQKFPFKVFLTIFFKSFHSPRFIFFLFFVCFCNNYCIINHILTNWISFFLFFIPFFFSIFFSIFFLCFCCCCCCYSIFP